MEVGQFLESIGMGVDTLDLVEAEMLARFPPVEFPLTHEFTPGLYIRSIYMPAGSLLTSKIHMTEHPYVITAGDVSVFTEREGVVRLKAPHRGITKPGTRRLLFIHEDTIWTTFHPTEETDVSKIEEQIMMPHTNPLLQEALAGGGS